MDELAFAAWRPEGAGVNSQMSFGAHPSRRAPIGALLRMRSGNALLNNILILRSLAERGVAKDGPRERTP